MASVLKRLREVAEMREAGVTDRDQFRTLKELRDEPRRVPKYFAARQGAKEEERGRSKRALDELSRNGTSIKTLARAMHILFFGKDK